jgi:hypothetical protein
MFQVIRRPRKSKSLPWSQVSLRIGSLEDRLLPSASFVSDHIVQSIGPGQRGGGGMIPLGSTIPPSSAKTPAQIRGAYGVNNIVFGSVAGDGSGQTIAIVDAFNDPSFVSSNDPNFNTSDLHRFDVQFNLPDPPLFIKSSQTGSITTFPTNNTGWGTEIALDVEWAHAMAPGACIVLVESLDNGASLYTGATFAKSITGATFAAFPNLPPVSCVTMSWGINELSGNPTINPIFTTPPGHTGVTFFASAGDAGAPGVYPAFSPNVVAVGGTSLFVSGNNWSSETGWSRGGGGISTVEAKPAYQSLVIQSSNHRTSPDVAMDADPNTGVAVLDSFTQGTTAPWLQVGGTSVSSPLWAAFVAIANQGRVSVGEATLDGPNGTLPKLYAEMSLAGVAVTDFHDVASGNNGFPAGLGTPVGAATIANLMDDAPPTAAATVTSVTSASAQPYSFTVAYADNHNVKFRSLDSSDIVVQGPGGAIPTTLVSVNQTSDGSLRTATYQFSPPGGSWDAADNGNYSVVLQANQVSDTAGNFAIGAIIGTFNVALAPSVVSTQINDGSAQRSVVSSLTVTFSAQVAFANNDPSSAFSLMHADNSLVSFTANATVVNGRTVVTLSAFGGTAADHGSLADGRFTLKALAANINAGGVMLDGNNDGVAGGDYAFSNGLFRIFGDANGDGAVDVADLTLFASSFGLTSSQSGFLSYFDTNNDGLIDVADLVQFANRFGTVLP